MVKSWLVQDQTVLGKDYSNLLIADSLLKTIWFINAPCYGNEALASPKANELTIPEQTATGKGTSNPFMADEIPPPPSSSQSPPSQQTPHTVSAIKLPILKKGEYDIWAMKMEHYLAHIDYPIWEVIQNRRFVMSSNNSSSTVTYTSVSSDSNGPSSWGIPLENASEIPDVDPYEEITQQGQAHPLSPAYVPDPMELDEHVPLYAPELEHLKHHDDTDADSIDYPDEPGTDDEHEDPEEDPSEEHEPKNEDANEDESFEDSDKTDPFEENETAATPLLPRSPQTRIPFSQTRLRRARKTVRLELPMPASMEARIAEHAVAPIPFTSPTYDQAPLGHKEAMIRMRDDIPKEDMPPRRRFVLTAPPPGCDVVESFAAAAARAPRGQYDFVDAIGAGQALQTSEHRMMTSIEEVNLRVSYQAQVRKQESGIFYTQLHDARTDRRDIRLEIDVVRCQRTAYEAELHEVRQDYLSFEARNRALLARLEALETHMSRMEWQR
ncbi:hypothetical protein Tco_0551491 [Tanacetum coccineum]